MKFNFYSDPGHGWVKIPVDLLKKLGIANNVSPYSYRHGNNAYLEEDGDLSLFIKAMNAVGKSVEFREFHANKSSKIRSYNRYYS